MNTSPNFASVNASVAAIVLFQVAALFARSVLQGELLATGQDPAAAKHLSYLAVPLIELLLFWPILRANKAAVFALFAAPPSWARMLFYSVLLGVCARLSYWGAVVANAAFDWFGYAQPGQGNAAMFWFACPSAFAVLLGVVVMGALTPIGEELINRGLLLGALLQRGRICSIVLSAILFSVLHDAASIVPAFVIGILLARQVLVSGSILPAIIAHATYNLLAIIDWSCLHGSWNPEFPTVRVRLIGIFAIAICAAGLALAFHLTRSPMVGTSLQSRP